MNRDIKVVRMATGDLFNTGQATDNYIEKYLPFALQALISRNMLASITRPLLKKKKKQSQMSKEDDKNLKNYTSFRNCEYAIFKEMHDEIMEDHGVSNLAKR